MGSKKPTGGERGGNAQPVTANAKLQIKNANTPSFTILHFTFFILNDRHSVTVMVISTRSSGLSRPSRLAFTMVSATSVPLTTSPNAVYCQSRKFESATQMKNCEPALSGSLDRAMDKTPRLCGLLLNSALTRWPGPPVPWEERSWPLLFGSPP